MRRSFALRVLCLLSAGLVYADVLIDETFDNAAGRISARGALKRVAFVKAVEGNAVIGTDLAAHFKDDSPTESGILEYNAGDSAAGGYFISFDLLNNSSTAPEDSMRLIFSMGQWSDGKNFMLTSGSKRAFSVEFEQAGSSKALSIRVGTATVKKSSYDVTALQQVKIWVNDNDKKELPYIRPDTKQEAMLNPDSVVIWINDQLVADQRAGGIAMQSSISDGDAVLGRLGFSSISTSFADFLLDNVHVESFPGSKADGAVLGRLGILSLTSVAFLLPGNH